jgi:hypothetical protein
MGTRILVNGESIGGRARLWFDGCHLLSSDQYVGMVPEKRREGRHTCEQSYYCEVYASMSETGDVPQL